ALCHLCRGRRAGRPRGGAARAPAAAMSQSDRLLLEDLPSGCAPRCTRSCSARSLTILQRRSARAGHPGFRGQPAAVLEGRPAAPARRLPVPVGGPAARLRRAAGPRLAGPARAEVGRPRRGGAAGDAGHAGPSERGRAPRPRSASARGCWRQRGRTWLLIGPLVGRLQFLRDAAQRARQAAATAAPGDAAGAAARALGQPPPVVSLRVRRLETCWIVSKPDRVQVILSIHLDDEVDVALARAFCQEFAEANRNPQVGSLPCTFNEPKDTPIDLRELGSFRLPNVGFIAFTLSDQIVESATEDRLHSLARPVMTFRNFFNFHLKHAKSYLHSRLRKRLDGWQQQLNKARRAPRKGQEKVRRMASGREFRPPPRGEAAPP
ncbi:unnamed protein product, partial [Prorocentrum cordatum]